MSSLHYYDTVGTKVATLREISREISAGLKKLMFFKSEAWSYSTNPV